jgi:hypothetical protein
LHASVHWKILLYLATKDHDLVCSIHSMSSLLTAKLCSTRKTMTSREHYLGCSIHSMCSLLIWKLCSTRKTKLHSAVVGHTNTYCRKAKLIFWCHILQDVMLQLCRSSFEAANTLEVVIFHGNLATILAPLQFLLNQCHKCNFLSVNLDC